jgi:hypothetical protein
MVADARVERSLYSRAVGYSFNSEKVFCNKEGEVTRVPIVEHVPPDVTACIFWLKNRDPAHWRDAWQFEHTLGKYIISYRPMIEQEGIDARADVIDVTPEKEPPADNRLVGLRVQKRHCHRWLRSFRSKQQVHRRTS